MPNIIPQPNNTVNGSDLKIVFLGTPEFAVPVLTKLADSKYRPLAVFCAPDKPVGRKQILTPPPTKIVAQKYNIPVFQPDNKSELAKIIAELKPDIILSAAYGIIVPKEVLEAPKYGCLNIHPSLLPRWRGASPIQYAILNGDAETGATIFKMDEGVDTGPIIVQKKYSLSPSTSLGINSVERSKLTTPELSKELAELGAQLLIEILPDWIAGKITPTSQDNSQAVYAPQIKKEDGQINWQKSAVEIERQIRAFTPWPGTYSTIPAYPPSEIEGSKIKIIKGEVFEKSTGKQPGEAFLTDSQNLAIQTGSGSLIIEELQLEGGKPMSATDFLRGHQDIIGQILF